MAKLNDNGGGADKSKRLRMAERLKSAREYLGFSQDEVAGYLRVPATEINDMETGRSAVSSAVLKRLAALYRRPIVYFTRIKNPAGALSADVRRLIKNMPELTPRDREELAKFAEFLKYDARVKGGEMVSALCAGKVSRASNRCENLARPQEQD